VLFFLLLPLGLWLGVTWVERALLIGTAGLVLIVELLNSAIESAVDRISMEHHELSKRAKDLGSAAVMLSLLLCAAVWACTAWVRFSN
jgi:diacylglycerol kinase (ATP)